MQTKGSFQDNSFYFLLWGWVIMLINLSIYLLLYFNTTFTPYYLWALTIPVAIISVWYGIRQEKKAR
jgi:uncharacterized membrane protein